MDGIIRTVVAIVMLLNTVLYSYAEPTRIYPLSFYTNQSTARLNGESINAFDNNTNTDAEQGSCSHTEKHTDSWWYVDLEEQYTILSVELYNRESHGDRLKGARVRIGSGLGQPEHFKQNIPCGDAVKDIGTNPIFLKCESNPIGNIVSVQLENVNNFLTLCEVMIFGTAETSTPSASPDVKLVPEGPLVTDILSKARSLAEGQHIPVEYYNLRGIVVRLFRNGTLPKTHLTENEDSVSVALQIPQGGFVAIVLFGQPENFTALSESVKEKKLVESEKTEVRLGSDIFICSVYDVHEDIVAGTHVEFILPASNLYEKNHAVIETPTCAFLNETLSQWSTYGCNTSTHNGDVTCVCNHTTSYAILFQSNSVDVPEDDAIMSILTYIGLSISTIFLFLALGTKIILPELAKSARFKILSNVIIGAIISNIVFMALELANKNQIVCGIAAGILQYSLLLMFMWMLIFSSDLYAKVFYSFANHSKRMRWCNIIGWSLPMIIVIITVALSKTQYASDECWLNNDALVYGFIAPSMFIVFVNIAMIGRVLVEVSKKSRSANVTEKRKMDDLKHVAVRASLLLPVIGVTWVLGMINFFTEETAVMYLFVIANTCQGIFIWLTQFVWSREVSIAWTNRKKRRNSTTRHHPQVRLTKITYNSDFKDLNDSLTSSSSPPMTMLNNTLSTLGTAIKPMT